MNEQPPNIQPVKPANEEAFHILSEIHKSPHFTQRDLSSKLNISLGKTNYLVKELIKKGMLKAKSFSYNPEKLKKVKYILTKKGMEEKINLTYHFLKRKESEYNRIKSEWESLNKLRNGNLEHSEIPESSIK